MKCFSFCSIKGYYIDNYQKKIFTQTLDIVLTFLQITFLLVVRRFFRPDIKKILHKKSACSVTQIFYVFKNGFFSKKKRNTKFTLQLHYFECMKIFEEGYINRECSCRN